MHAAGCFDVLSVPCRPFGSATMSRTTCSKFAVEDLLAGDEGLGQMGVVGGRFSCRRLADHRGRLAHSQSFATRKSA